MMSSLKNADHTREVNWGPGSETVSCGSLDDQSWLSSELVQTLVILKLKQKKNRDHLGFRHLAV